MTTFVFEYIWLDSVNGGDKTKVTKLSEDYLNQRIYLYGTMMVLQLTKQLQKK